MDEKLKKLLIGGAAVVVILGSGFVAYRSLRQPPAESGIADSAKEILSHSNNTEVLTDAQKKDVLARGMAPGTKKVKP
ncbi:MAG: hypothetical protein ACYC96_02845 [Fimbriimonadaceae bacterium]